MGRKVKSGLTEFSLMIHADHSLHTEEKTVVKKKIKAEETDKHNFFYKRSRVLSQEPQNWTRTHWSGLDKALNGPQNDVLRYLCLNTHDMHFKSASWMLAKAILDSQRS